MQTTKTATETITYGGVTVEASRYGQRYGEGQDEWRINLADQGVGYGVLRAATIEALYEAFTDFITEAMADQAAAHEEQHGDIDIDDFNYDFNFETDYWEA